MTISLCRRSLLFVMKPYILLTDPEIVGLLQGGAVCALPTDTVYGLVCRASDPDAVARLYQLKHREHKPGTIIAADIDQLVTLGLKRRYVVPVTQYWPGPISVIIPCGPDLEYLHQGIQSLAVRLPAGDKLQRLLRLTGPLLTSSANLAGQPPAQTIVQAIDYFGDQVAAYVDGGDLSDAKPSTIVRIVDDAVEVVRRGAATIDEA